MKYLWVLRPEALWMRSPAPSDLSAPASPLRSLNSLPPQPARLKRNTDTRKEKSKEKLKVITLSLSLSLSGQKRSKRRRSEHNRWISDLSRRPSGSRAARTPQGARESPESSFCGECAMRCAVHESVRRTSDLRFDLL
eukprot:scaffold2739_cov257-Pinguiococcus_pyrenoidosus.AAC.32